MIKLKKWEHASNEEFAKWFEVKPEELTEKPKTRVMFDLEDHKQEKRKMYSSSILEHKNC